MAKKQAVKKAVKRADHAVSQAGAAELMRVIIEGSYFSRWKLFRINLLRGIAFGIGVFVGSTTMVVLSVWILSALSEIPGLGGLVDTIQETIDSR